MSQTNHDYAALQLAPSKIFMDITRFLHRRLPSTAAAHVLWLNDEHHGVSKLSDEFGFQCGYSVLVILRVLLCQ